MSKLAIQEKYELSATHPDLKALEADLNELNKSGMALALDAGCNKGRNSVYLQSLGFAVDAVDIDPTRVEYLQNIIEQEKLEKISAKALDLTQDELGKDYDFINLTMVLHQIEPEGVYKILEKLQKHTKVGGINLIIAPLNTEETPKDFAFSFKFGELKQIYSGWKLQRYEEDWGLLGRRDENGERIKLKFVTMVAIKQA